MLISEALGLKERAFISLVGAGGKSTLFKRLAEELAHKNKRVILTTTTKMFSWQLAPFIKSDKLLKRHNEETTLESIKKYFFSESKGGGLAVIREEIEDDNGEEKLSGPPPEWLDKWWEEKIADYFLIEADGASGRPLKAPAPHEPVIPLSTTDLIGVIGIDVLGLPLQEENVFRSEIFSRLTGVKLGEKIGIKALAFLICHPEGLFKEVPPGCRRHLFINKVEDFNSIEMAEELAFEVLKVCHRKISDIIIGAAGQNEVVAEVIKEEKTL
ncbi:MAG: putative selenium-dependent hydroxylase accessory protein YqeC [Candidatus Atribacteria bacterium]|nr:MAG: putative selenium-dependent hydroxylase accessory protein YqeC [Candidatus Atribacteria bacterium]